MREISLGSSVYVNIYFVLVVHKVLKQGECFIPSAFLFAL
jgi:hypothetical protein